ncbi:MAG: succinylglutamate desuccinylase/aspartoacylase family protein [Microbacteriaceae bacterium]|nr:succinylglutamate desuccinylase/aspartoacylase family protein [Burkholderiaceae bacterium]
MPLPMMPARLPAPLHPFQSVAYAGLHPGVRLVVTGAVHGNETCGTRAIRRVMAELDAGALTIVRGAVTFVPVCNPLAFHHHRRAGDRNLNRALAPTSHPREYEDHVANWLCPLLAAHDGLLDLHSFQSAGQPFVMVGPRDNRGDLEPFGQAAQEEALVRVLGVQRAVDGWLTTYAHGVARRLATAQAAAPVGTAATVADLAAAAGAPARLDLHPRYGVGTTEYLRSQGGWALTLECGQHDDPQSPEVAYRAIRNTLAHTGLIDEPAPRPAPVIEALSIHEVIDKQHAGDRFARDWQSFDAVRAGTLIGTRATGEAVHAPGDGWLLFPNARAEARHEWFYLARVNPRFGPEPAAAAPPRAAP